MAENLELLEKNQLVNIVKTQNETISFLVKEVEKYFKLYNSESDKREIFVKKTIKEIDEILRIV